jgi:hypothetical protein
MKMMKQITLDGTKFKAPKFKLGEYVMKKYRWDNEPKMDYLYKIVKIYKDGVDVELSAAKEDGKWIQRYESADHFNWGLSHIWDFSFKLGKINPVNGWGKAFKYEGKLPFLTSYD